MTCSFLLLQSDEFTSPLTDVARPPKHMQLLIFYITCGSEVSLVFLEGLFTPWERTSMEFELMRNERGGLVLDKAGDFLAKDNKTNGIVWLLPQSMVKFDGANEAYIDVCSQAFIQFQETTPQENAEENPDTDVHEDSSGERNNVQEESIEETSERQTWEYDEAIALISAVEARYDELYHPKTKKGFWDRISEELLSQKLQFSALACHRKWQNLQRTYKSTKDLKKKTGRGPTRFMYFDRLDELLGEKPNNSSPHSIDVATMQDEGSDTPVSTPNTDIGEDIDSNTIPKTTPAKIRKRGNPSMELVKIKTNYYLKKEATLEKKQKDVKDYLTESLQIKREKLELYRKKLQLEDRRVNAIEEYNARVDNESK